MDCTEIRKLIREGYIRTDARLLDLARSHLADCAGCSSLYHRLFSADAALADAVAEADGVEPSHRMLGPAEAALLQSGVVPPHRPRRYRRVALYLSPALAASLGLLLLHLPKRPDPGRFTARGASVDSGIEESLGLRALCLLETDGAIQFRSLGEGGCPDTARIGLTARNETGKAQHLRIFVLGAGQVREVYPAGQQVAPIAAGPGERPLDVAVDLRDEEAEMARIVGAFSTRGRDGRALHRAIVRGEVPDGVHLVEVTVKRRGPAVEP
jgi:hypothetical protein